MFHFLKTRWELLVALILFAVARIPALHFPFYWDESWSYAPAVKLMYLHGPSLMPNAIDLFYSRGHPLLFYAAAAAWMRVFGASHIAQHSFSLVISLALLVAIYEVCLRLFSKRTAIVASVIMPLQVMFFVQSTFLLPEVMIGLFSLLTLYFYVSGKGLLTFLCCTALMLVKESGMVMGLVLGVHAAFNLLNKKDSMKARLANFAALAFSGLAIGLFFLLQKRLNGWYFYPEHTGYISWDWRTFWDKFRFALDVLFCHDFRYRLFQLVMLLGLIVAVHLKDVRYATPLLPGYLVYVIIEDKFGWLPRKVLFAIFMLSLLYAGYQLVKLSAEKRMARTRFIYLCVFFIATYLAFTCINFFTARYLICALAIIIILAAAYLDLYIGELYSSIYYLTLACIVLIGIYGFKYDVGIGDLNLGAFDGMKVEEDVVAYFENAGLYDKSIGAANFQNREHLQKPMTGYLHSDKTFPNVNYDVTLGEDYLIFDNIEPDPKYQIMKNSPAYHLVYKTPNTGKAWAEVYQKIK